MKIKKDKNSVVAYFSLEIALESDLPTYSGGLGVLAGDLLRSAADIGFPLVGVTLLNRRGYLKQEMALDGRQIAKPESRYPFGRLEKTGIETTVLIGSETVRIRVWHYQVKGGAVSTSVYLLDTDVPGNKPKYRRLTDRLYDSDKLYRLQQEIVLGRGGVRMLAALGYDVKKYHLNEGHGSLAAVELFLSSRKKTAAAKLAEVRSRCIFTVHTPLPGAQDQYKKDFFLSYLRDWPVYLNRLFVDERINMTRAGLHCCGYTNAVSLRHRAVTRKMFSGHRIESITNGVNSSFWTAPEMQALFDKTAVGWRHDARCLAKMVKAAPEEIGAAHKKAKQRLIGYVRRQIGARLREDIFTIGFARRFTPYKRPGLIFFDLNRLADIALRCGGLQIIMAGKAHPEDKDGQELIRQTIRARDKLRGRVKVVFLEDYDLDQAKLLVSGTDLWLNTPQPPIEASGTSGMKAAHNGVPQLSTDDGWWPEGYKRGQTGWMIRETRQGNNLYELLDQDILPFFYGNPFGWSKLMRSTISRGAPVFNTDRTLREYIRQAYKMKGF